MMNRKSKLSVIKSGTKGEKDNNSCGWNVRKQEICSSGSSTAVSEQFINHALKNPEMAQYATRMNKIAEVYQTVNMEKAFVVRHKKKS